MDTEADALAERLAEVPLRVPVAEVEERPVVATVVAGLGAAELLMPWSSFLTVWLKVPVMPVSGKMAEKERYGLAPSLSVTEEKRMK